MSDIAEAIEQREGYEDLRDALIAALDNIPSVENISAGRAFVIDDPTNPLINEHDQMPLIVVSVQQATLLNLRRELHHVSREVRIQIDGYLSNNNEHIQSDSQLDIELDKFARQIIAVVEYYGIGQSTDTAENPLLAFFQVAQMEVLQYSKYVVGRENETLIGVVSIQVRGDYTHIISTKGPESQEALEVTSDVSLGIGE